MNNQSTVERLQASGTSDVREWLERLYGSSPGYFGLTTFYGGRPRPTKWFETNKLDKATKQIEIYSGKVDTYLSVGTHSEPQQTRGGESTIVSIPGLWSDLDIGEIGHKPASLPNPATEQEALSIIQGLPDASMLMHSGGGLQAFWLFDSPWVFNTKEEKAEGKKAVQEWANLLESLGKELGFHVDKVADLARILRAPGSVNHKEGLKRPTAIRWIDKPAHDQQELTAFGIPDSKTYETDSQPIEDDFPLSWNEILAPHGYTQCSETSWARPGKDCSEGISVNIAEFSPFVITNFSGSDPVLPEGKGTKLTKLRVHALLNFNGDLNKARNSLPDRKLKITWADMITPKPVHWLWEGRIAEGTLALLAGREGIGKSTLAYTLVSQITRGQLKGQFYGKPKSVVIVATEDSWEFTIVPRLMAAKADLKKVGRIDPTDEDEYGISLPRDIKELSSLVRENDIAMILLDPLMSRVDGKLDTHKDSEVRQALEPLVKMGTEANAAVLGLIHVNKSGSTDPLSTLMGSRAFSAVARAVLYVVQDAENPDTKIMMQAKNNLGRSDLPELAYVLKSKSVGTYGDEEIVSVELVWSGERPQGTAQSNISPKTQKAKVNNAEEWLQDMYGGRGEISSQEIKEAGLALGYGDKMLQRAMKEINGDSKRVRVDDKTISVWIVPASSFNDSPVEPWEL